MKQTYMEHSVELKDLWLGYRPGEYLVRGVNASVRQGEMVALVGRNGTGKSTLLRTIAGIQSAMKGEVLLNGRSIDQIPPRERSLLLSFVGTGSSFTENLTVFEMVSLGRHPYTNWWGALREADRQKIDQSIRFVGMEQFVDARVDRLSDGERQRVMIAMALAQDTRVMILDEPTAFLDIPNRIGIVEVLHRLKEEGRSVIFSTHEFDNAFSYADKIWAIHEGQLIEGAPEDLGMDGAYEKLFSESKVAFDAANLRFVRRRVQEKQIVLYAAKKSLDHWTRRALERVGYGVEPGRAELTGSGSVKSGDMKSRGTGIDETVRVGVPELRTGKDERGVYWKLAEGDNEKVFRSLYELTGFLLRFK
jgi:iron complex transport system ATP-binding protein